ncbi:CARDB domain-containing protein [Chroococcus sp. FPU101]|uniref:CARDB domain-containing protein n=1 Tax=Chroococcus sp. FPU101 TaxID=1974212 RepID=UPI001A8E7AD6|nr:CARDB domain-containing protein [Chroococcus sp. FPU101]GFE69627.1 hypothetical protein CFPU101_22370 [Chroococcus sp. FPU101]
MFDNALIDAGASAFTLDPLQTNNLISDSNSLGSSFEHDQFETTLKQYTDAANFSTQAVTLPDLRISQIATPASAVTGSTLNFNYTIKNLGGATGTSAGSTRFYLSRNNILDSTDTLLGTDAVSSLAAGASRVESASVTFNNNLTGGLYYLLAKADGQNAIAESNESNNVLAKAITLTTTPQPDLMFTNLTTPTVVAAGESYVNFSYTIKNQGTAATDWSSSETKFYLSTNSTLDSSDIHLATDYLYALDPGASFTESYWFSIDENVAGGTYYFIAKTDSNNTVVETNENNNITSKIITVTKPDLVISNLSAPTSAVGGDYIDISYTLKNQGNAGVAGYSNYTNFYLSTNTTLDSSDLDLGYDYAYSLAAGASQTSTLSYVHLDESLTTGTYYLFAKADGDNSVLESNENNNVFYRAINITEAPKADLTITSLVAPQQVTAGDALSVTFTLKNQGNASTGWYGSDTKFYFSRDTILDAADTYLDQVSSYSIDPNTSVTETASIPLSSRLAGGTYYLIAQADGNNDIVEKNENNNIFYRTIQINPSLDGYSSINGYGLVNASAAVAKALGQNPFPSVPNLGGNNWGADLINAPEVWAKGYTGQGIIVAVLDTGVDRNHSDLSSNIWRNTREINGNGIDDDRNGFVDDYWGWNFDSNNNNTMDGHSHGTHVAGTIAAVKNSFGVTGIAYNAKIMPVKVLSDSGSGSDSGVARGIRYAADNGAKVINMSLGGSDDDAELKAAVQYASSKGAIVVMAAGNDGDSTTMGHFPAAYATQWGLAIGAVDRYNQMADFSNRAGGTRLTYVTAAGVDVYSTVPNNGYDSYSGTSMATPHVAGVVALMLSAKAGLTDAQVRQILSSTAENSPTAPTTNSLPLQASLASTPDSLTLTHTSAPTVAPHDFESSEPSTTLRKTVHISNQIQYEQASLTSFDYVTGLVFPSYFTDGEAV